MTIEESFEKVAQDTVSKLIAHEITKDQAVASVMYLVRRSMTCFGLPPQSLLSQKREELGLTMDEVSKASGVSKSTISRMEKGNPCEYENVKKVYEALFN